MIRNVRSQGSAIERGPEKRTENETGTDTVGDLQAEIAVVVRGNEAGAGTKTLKKVGIAIATDTVKSKLNNYFF